MMSLSVAFVYLFLIQISPNASSLGTRRMPRVEQDSFYLSGSHEFTLVLVWFVFLNLEFSEFCTETLVYFLLFFQSFVFFFVFLIAPPPSFCYKVTSKLFFKFSICLYFQGDYAVNFRILDEDSGELGCLNLRFAMKKRNKGWLFRI